MHRNQLVRRVATVTVGTALSVAAVGGSAWAASPQPASTADFSGHGANVSGPYDSTRDGRAAANGNGGGHAVGKPCAGCVGKADNKNPKGQLPGGSDRNAGYECDRNKGIGQGNPAHTGCTTTTSTSAMAVTDVPVRATTTVVSGTRSEGASAVSAGVAPAHVLTVAATGASGRPAMARTAVLGMSVTRAAHVSSSLAAGTLPFTGAPVRGLLLVALVALTTGIALTAGLPRLTAPRRIAVAVTV